MSIASYYKERNRLIAEQKKEREILLAYNILEEDISKLHQEDYNVWKANRVYRDHNNISSDGLGEEALGFIRLQENPYDDLYGKIGNFLDSIENEKLFTALKTLKEEELSMVEACWVNGETQNEYAASIGLGQAALSKRLNRIRNWLRKEVKYNYLK